MVFKVPILLAEPTYLLSYKVSYLFKLESDKSKNIPVKIWLQGSPDIPFLGLYYESPQDMTPPSRLYN